MKRKKRKKFSIIEEYERSWDYIKESKRFIYIALGIFLFFLLIGFFVPAPKILADELLKFLRDLLKQTEGLSPIELIQFIISNNVKTTLFSIFFGVILGIFPIINTIMNGYVLGFVFLLTVNNSGIGELWRILPHGIFELPAVFISFGLGIKLGMFIFQKKKLICLKDYLINSFKVFLLIILPLLIIAGIIEGILINLIA